MFNKKNSPLYRDRVAFARFLYELKKRVSDLQRRYSGTTVYYGIDSDVVMLITSPWNRGSENPFAELFTDVSVAQDAFCFLFAEHVYRNFSATPFLLISPSDSELDGLWNDIYRNAIESIDEADDSAVPQIKQLTSVEGPELYRHVSAWTKAVHGAASPIAHLERINRLSSDGILRRLDSIKSPDGSYPFPISTPEIEKDILKAAKRWTLGLDKIRKNKTGNNAVDGAVLARIEIMNRLMRDRGQNTVLCFVTGDTHINRLASNISIDGAETFADAYLRSPVSFLIDRPFFGSSDQSEDDPFLGSKPIRLPGEHKKVGISNWLYSLLHLEMTATLDELGQEQLATQLGQVKKKWTEFLQSSSARLQLSEEVLNGIIRQNVDSVPHAENHLDILETLEQLRKRYILIRREAAKGFAASAALTHFWSLDSSADHKNGRGVPCIRFDSFKAAHKLAGLMSSVGGLQNTRLTLRYDWVAELKQEDKSGYTVLIVISLAFAYAGQWDTALTIVTWAHALALREKEFFKNSTVKGDEAAYLSAVFCRLSAKNKDDLKPAITWLHEARSLLNTPPIRKSLLNSNDVSSYDDIRFKAEDLAIEVTGVLFSYFQPAAEIGAKPIMLTVQIGRLSSRHLLLMDEMPRDIQAHIAAYVRNQLIINYLQLEILRRLLGDRNPDVSAATSALIDSGIATTNEFDLLNEIEKFSASAKSDLVCFVLLCAILIFCPERVGESRDAFQTSALEHSKRLRTMPYDLARAEDYFRLAVNDYNR